MHPLVRLYLKTGFAFLVLGLLAGLWVQERMVRGGTFSHGMIVAHVHLLLVGFLVVFVLGVAMWLFPRAGRGQPIGPWPGLVAAAYVMLTVGTAARAVTEFFETWLTAPVWAYLRLAAATLQVAGIAAGITALWGRVRGAAITRVEPPAPGPPAP